MGAVFCLPCATGLCGLDKGALLFRRPDRLADRALSVSCHDIVVGLSRYRERDPVRLFPSPSRLRLPIPRSAVFAALPPFLGLNSSVLVAAALLLLVLPSNVG